MGPVPAARPGHRPPRPPDSSLTTTSAIALLLQGVSGRSGRWLDRRRSKQCRALLGLLIDDAGAITVRPTDDLDVIIDVSSRVAYYGLEARLRGLGFRPDRSAGAPVCRWIVDDVTVDVMPTSIEILGFTNRWYADAMTHAVRRNIAPELAVRVATAPYFVGMKLEAYAGRGNGDVVASHDLEDIIAIVDGHASLVDEVEASSTLLRDYLRDRIGALLDDDASLAAVPGHLAGDAGSQARRPLVLARLHLLAGRGRPGSG